MKARGQGTGEGRGGFQIMIHVGHLGKEEREGRSVGEGEPQTCRSLRKFQPGQ